MATPIPLDVLFGAPERVLPSFSPDANHMAWLAPVDGALNLHVDGVPRSADPRGLASYRWLADSTHIVWVQDDRGDENFHLVSLDLATDDVRDLTPFDGVRAQLVAASRSLPATVLVGLNRRDPRVFDLYRVVPDDGTCELVAENNDVDDWLVDRSMRLVGATRMRDDGRVDVLAPDSKCEDGWRVAVSDVGDYLAVLPLGVASNGDLILRTDKGSDTRYLARLDMATGLSTTVFADPVFDVASAELHPATGEPQLVVVERERAQVVTLDPDLRVDIDGLRALHGGRPVIVSRDQADQEWIVGYLSDSGPVAHYRWNRSTHDAEFLFDHRPAMNDYEWSAMEPFEFTARDGLTIHGYLTYPPGELRVSLPGVVNVHGGPWRRNTWSLDPEGQWLASRGYLCIHVNFRGSSGYGGAFLDAGDKQWGAAMNDDLVDAAEHLTALGVLDPSRVAVMGTSYGGYATLAALAFTPDVFACGIAHVAPSNLVTFIDSLPTYWQPNIDLWHRRVGHPIKDREMLLSRSPITAIEHVRSPVMLVHGARDPRVPQAESAAFAAALARRGIEHEYLVFDDEGHGLAQTHNRTTFYQRAEAFLSRHLHQAL